MDSTTPGANSNLPARPMTPDHPAGKNSFRAGVWQKLHHLFGKDEAIHSSEPQSSNAQQTLEGIQPTKTRSISSRPVGVGLPRQTTFKRQNSEKRERLCPVDPSPGERRAVSTSRNQPTILTNTRSRSSPPPYQSARNSAPAVAATQAAEDICPERPDTSDKHDEPDTINDEAVGSPRSIHTIESDASRPPRPASTTSSIDTYERQQSQLEERARLNTELDTRWILNLSMHFRDKSDREKFFVTYAQAPNKWRRVTVSIDYRSAEPGSLEMDLKELEFQRDKSLQIYESIRDSLTEIQFYETVTNLKLETREGRLHVHVTEDANEIIPYPPISSIHHITHDDNYRPLEVCETDLSFGAHLSGFVYRVKHNGAEYIKKEIPGPDTVDEFLYELNALHALYDSENVIHLEGIVVDESHQLVKGILISFAERGAIVDLLYDHKGQIPWEQRQRWARDAVQGLSEIHEEGYVQGDFTLSNIVVDKSKAKIIDINRRGCPVGWEPPELAKKIASHQRISMYIGQKSDLYQLGMTLWALAMDDDEPERHGPPLSTSEFPSEVPGWYQAAVRICLSERPRDRISAKELLRMFPAANDESPWLHRAERSLGHHLPDKRYIDPQTAVERDDLERFRDERNTFDLPMYSSESSREDYTFTYPHSSNYEHDYESTSSESENPRGRKLVSEHDRMLHTQNVARRTEVDGAETNSANNLTPNIITIEPEDPFFYEVDSNGLPRHFSETIDEAHLRAVRHHEVLQREMLERTASEDPTIGQTTPNQLTITTHAYNGRSEASDGTPRNSSHQFPNAYPVFRTNPQAREGADHIPSDLTGLGSHPNVSVESIEHLKQSPDSARVGVESHTQALPHLAFQDSGFGEMQLLCADTVEAPIPSLSHAVESSDAEVLTYGMEEPAPPEAEKGANMETKSSITSKMPEASAPLKEVDESRANVTEKTPVDTHAQSQSTSAALCEEAEHSECSVTTQ